MRSRDKSLRQVRRRSEKGNLGLLHYETYRSPFLQTNLHKYLCRRGLTIPIPSSYDLMQLSKYSGATGSRPKPSRSISTDKPVRTTGLGKMSFQPSPVFADQMDHGLDFSYLLTHEIACSLTSALPRPKYLTYSGEVIPRNTDWCRQRQRSLSYVDDPLSVLCWQWHCLTIICCDELGFRPRVRSVIIHKY